MKDRTDIADNTFSDEGHFYLNARLNKGFTHVSWVQIILN